MAKSMPKTSAIDDERDQIGLNVAAVQKFYARESDKLSHSQRLLERLSELAGHPLFFVIILLFVGMWAGLNMLCRALGWSEFDPAPFFWLQGIVGLFAWLTATGVLSRQNRLAKLAEQRSNLDLKVILLTEQKVAKLIDLMEELRRDLPNVKDRHDPSVESLQQAMNPSKVLEALDDKQTSPSAAQDSSPAA